jgi:hypothetical protein
MTPAAIEHDELARLVDALRAGPRPSLRLPIAAARRLVGRNGRSSSSGRLREARQKRRCTKAWPGGHTGASAEVTYRMESDRPLVWIGDGLREVGIEPGTMLGQAMSKQC